ncbi:MAG: hypothetical protein AAGF12_10750, partial [Myxococcota bacterium]
MPDYLSLYTITPAASELPGIVRTAIETGALEYPAVRDHVHTYPSLAKHLRALNKIAPELRLSAVYRSPVDWLAFEVMLVSGGVARAEKLELSRKSDVFEPLIVEPAPEVTLKLEVEADEILDVVATAAESPDFLDRHGRELRLPLRYVSADAIVEMGTHLCRHITAEEIECICEVQDQLGLLRLRRGEGAELEPVFLYHEDEEV